MRCTRWIPRSSVGLYLSLLTLLPLTYCGQINVTIDDQYGDPTTGQSVQYNPREAWSVGQNCGSCTAKPRPISDAYNSTWMDATYFPNDKGTSPVSGQTIAASVPFIGTAVYVQVILTGSTDFPAGDSDFVFYIDGSIAGDFRKAADGDTSYKFNQTVFSTSGLSNSLHTVTIESGRLGRECLFLLDSIIYTKETTDSSNGAEPSGASSDSDPNIGVIVGPVVGGVTVAGAIIALLFFLRRRRQGQRVRALVDSPPLESITTTSGGSAGEPLRNISSARIDPFVSTTSFTPYSINNGSRPDVSSVSYMYGSSGLNFSAPMDGRVVSSVDAVPASPPSYSEVNGSSNVPWTPSRLKQILAR